MIPGNVIETTPKLSDYEYSESLLTITPKTHYVVGGVGISDPSQGRTGYMWECKHHLGAITIRRTDRQTVDFSMPVAATNMVGMAFDNNMAPVIAYQVGTVSYLRYYDAQAAAFVTISKTGTSSCRCCVDNPKPFYNGESDVFFAFTRAGQLFYTLQRDKYLTEYLVGSTTKKLLRMGPSKGLRLQFGLG